MRFKPTPRSEQYQFTDRKRQAFARKQRNEQERFPLLAEQIAQEQHSVMEEEMFRTERMQATEARMRAFHAGVWRRVRAMYYALPAADRAVIRQRWLNWSGPAEPTSLSYLIRLHTGEYHEIGVRQRAEAAAIRAQLQSQEQGSLQFELREAP
ncbi:hypothetical protein [Pseudomonas fulva]|uniref:hypothetical protein n=1 Tax=Pseudomonas fulva TaxID=47880 RepID=UPI002DB6A3E0|nr:hypothetical protein [Pseudomonas fulva]MEB8059246.1 hypothetical protein [Pseudomonas fulva]